MGHDPNDEKPWRLTQQHHEDGTERFQREMLRLARAQEAREREKERATKASLKIIAIASGIFAIILILGTKSCMDAGQREAEREFNCSAAAHTCPPGWNN